MSWMCVPHEFLSETGGPHAGENAISVASACFARLHGCETVHIEDWIYLRAPKPKRYIRGKKRPKRRVDDGNLSEETEPNVEVVEEI